ncbi:MAG: secretin N-terminal domain-containing protein [Pirellulaceae bacterium]
MFRYFTSRRDLFRALLSLTVNVVLCGVVSSQTHLSTSQEMTPAMRESLSRRINLDLRDSTLLEAIFTLRDASGLNIVVGNEVQGTVNASFQNSSIYEILDSLLITRGYGYRIVGGSIAIVPLASLGDQLPLFETAIIQLVYSSPADLLPVVESMLSPEGRTHAVASSNALVVIDYPERIAKIRSQMTTLEDATSRHQNRLRPTTPTMQGNAPAGSVAPGMIVRVFRPQYVKASVLATALTPLLSRGAQGLGGQPNLGGGQVAPPGPAGPLAMLGQFAGSPQPDIPQPRTSATAQVNGGQGGQITAIEAEDKLVVIDTPESIERIEMALCELDQPRPQVRIWALIYDCGIEDAERLGINWRSGFNGNSVDAATGNASQSIVLDTMTAAVNSTPNGVLTMTSLNSYADIAATLQALNAADDSRLLADPNVVVMNHEAAKIEIVTEVPYQQLTQGLEGGTIGTTEFREAGVTLNVTPHIAQDNTISLVVNPRFSLLTGFTEGDNAPIIDRRETTTTVRVRNRQTLVLGGLRQRTRITENNAVPVLSKIPYIGCLFRHRSNTARESELLVFITPEIIPPCYQGTHREMNILPMLSSEVAQTPTHPIPFGIETIRAEDHAKSHSINRGHHLGIGEPRCKGSNCTEQGATTFYGEGPLESVFTDMEYEYIDDVGADDAVINAPSPTMIEQVETIPAPNIPGNPQPHSSEFQRLPEPIVIE